MTRALSFALIASLAASAAASPADPKRPGSVRQHQYDVLRAFGVSEAPPDLDVFGLEREHDLYLKKESRVPATSKELEAALEARRTIVQEGQTPALQNRERLREALERLGALENALGSPDKAFDNARAGRPAQAAGAAVAAGAPRPAAGAPSLSPAPKDAVRPTAPSPSLGDRAADLRRLASRRDPANKAAFIAALNDSDPKVRDAAALGLGNILAQLAVDKKGGDWSRYIQAAPEIMSALALGPDQLDPERTARRIIAMNLNLSNLMEYEQVGQLARGYKDPRVMMILMGANDLRYVGEWTGLHSDDYRYYYTRLKTLSGGKLSSVFEDPRVNRETKLNVLARFVDFRLIDDALASDARMLQVLPRLMFASGAAGLRASGVWQIDDVARRHYGNRFYQAILDALPELAPAERRAAAHFLKLHPAQLTAAQKQALAQEAAVPAAPAPAPYWANWPKDTLTMHLIMTKAWSYGDALKAKLGQSGYRAVTDDRKEQPRRIELVRPGKPEVRLKIQVYASNEELDWWAADHDKLTQSMVDAMKDPEAQVVFFRGHAGDYIFEPVSRIQTQDKVYVDLTCYSDFRSQSAIRNCKDCAYFGSIGTTNGPGNDAVMHRLIEDLPARIAPGVMVDRFAAAVGYGRYYMTGTGSQADQWRRDLSGR